MNRAALLVVALILTVTPARAADEPAAGGAPQYKKMPWHLIDVWWDLGRDVPFESYSIDVTLSDDAPDDVNLYVAPIGIATLGTAKFYGGLQTNSDGYSRADPKLRKIGRGLLMSMWGERGLDAIRPSDGGLYQSSGHEGDFVSVRRPYRWEKGTYTYRVVRMDRQAAGAGADAKSGTWVGAFLYSHAKDENVFIGSLRFPGENLVLGRKVANFVEIYGKERPVDAIPKLTVTFGNLKVNGTPVERPTTTAIYPNGVPDYADAVAKDGQVVITVGTPVAGREKRSVKLIGE